MSCLSPWARQNFSASLKIEHFCLIGKKTFLTYDTEFVLFLAKSFSYLWDRVCSIFRGAGKFCLAHGLRQLTRDTICDVSCLQMLTKLQMTFGFGFHATLVVNIPFKTSIFPIIGKKNNQWSVSDATEKSQPSGQRIMPETRFTSFSALSVDPRIGISQSVSETDDRFCLSQAKI